MKKLLIATLLFTSLAAFVPTASAGHKKKKDHCDHSDYRPSYRGDFRPSYGYYQAPPVYCRPVPVVRYRGYDDDCRHRTQHRSALSFIFGF